MPAHVTPRFYKHQNLLQIHSQNPPLYLRVLAVKPKKEELPQYRSPRGCARDQMLHYR